MKNTQEALIWIIGVLKRHSIPFRISGGFAAKIYGSTRELADIDIGMDKQRLAFAKYSNIYKRKCDVLEHTEMMISPVAPIMPWITYNHETYYSDKWDPFSYGRDVQQDESFL